jgi:hypothetical protein
MLVQLALIVVLIAGNFFSVAAEFSITRIRPTEIAELEADWSRSLRGYAGSPASWPRCRPRPRRWRCTYCQTVPLVPLSRPMQKQASWTSSPG